MRLIQYAARTASMATSYLLATKELVPTMLYSILPAAVCILESNTRIPFKEENSIGEQCNKLFKTNLNVYFKRKNRALLHKMDCLSEICVTL